MNGIHDMGGMHGFGPIEREEHEPPFHAAWEGRVFAAINLAAGRYFSAHAARYGMERMPPAEYLRANYFARWLASLEYNLLQQGLLDEGELDARLASMLAHPGTEPPRAAALSPAPRAPEPSAEVPAPRFAVGDAVVARNIQPTGHTRLPRYVRGKRGVIAAVRRPQVFPDTDAHGLGENRHAVYNVRFAARELWGDDAAGGDTVSLDLWERYLDRA